MEKDLLAELLALDPEDALTLVEDLPPASVLSVLESLPSPKLAGSGPLSPIEQAHLIDAGYRERPHLTYMSERIRQAVEDVEAGQNRRLIVMLPPRTGKTTMTTQHSAAWILQRHPDWPIALTSYDGRLATSWGRQLRRWVEEGYLPGVSIARDAGAASDWETPQGGIVLARSLGEPFTGRGAKALFIDDPHKDFASAHSPTSRQSVWDWYLAVAQLRLEAPSLTVVTMTRWHEDDLVGRLLSREYPGDPDDWEVIRAPAIAEHDDPLGREVGDPLYSPLLEETKEEALERWAEMKESVGTYTWEAMFQQRPSPPEGAIFNISWFEYWTDDPDLVDPDAGIHFFDPHDSANRRAGRWVESWDMSFKGSSSSDFVVGQRWVALDGIYYLTAQTRGRFTFTQTLDEVEVFTVPHVHTILVEDAANGPAVIDTLKTSITGLEPVTPRGSKESRARAESPLVEQGKVRIPLPAQAGNEWVTDWLSEVRDFPNAANDDQVDAFTQALSNLKTTGKGSYHVPQGRITRNYSPRQTITQRRISR